ncbi:MAG: phosphoenolpyruvate-protein phosphotransferase [Candidatus Omnitrophota bacterium]
MVTKRKKDLNKSIYGMCLVPGIAFGEALLMKYRVPNKVFDDSVVVEVDYEILKLDNAIQVLKKEFAFIKDKVNRETGSDEAGIFAAHSMIVEDVGFINEIKQIIKERRISLEDAIDDILTKYTKKFEAITNPRLRDKIIDLRDVLMRIQKQSTYRTTNSLSSIGNGDYILVTEEILPSSILNIHENHIHGIVTVVGGLGSHASVLAKSYNVPVVAVSKSAIKKIVTGSILALDGHKSKICINPTESELSVLDEKRKAFDFYKADIHKKAQTKVETVDGQGIQVLANCGTLSEIDDAMDAGADGVGLFRTEFIFHAFNAFPSEEDQYTMYKEAALKCGQKPLTIRTLDLGGDKALPYFLIPKQMNPYLGWRSLKISFDHKDEFKRQIRAILRASAHGDIRILFPMVTSYWDAVQCQNIIAECKEELRSEKKVFKADIQVGAMIETPSAILCLADIYREINFISIGSNDLTQHVLAVDRNNPRVSEFYTPHHPSMINLLGDIFRQVPDVGDVSICGEMASHPYYIELLLNLGFRKLSMSASFIPIVKDIVKKIDLSRGQEKVNELKALKQADAIFEELKQSTLQAWPMAKQIVGE